jgi:hypothetical protein
MIEKFTKEDIENFGSEVKAVFVIVVSTKDENTVIELQKELKRRLHEDFWAYHATDEITETLAELGISKLPSLLVRVDNDEGTTTYLVDIENVNDILTYVDDIRDGDFKGLFDRGGDKLVVNSDLLKEYLNEVLKVEISKTN